MSFNEKTGKMDWKDEFVWMFISIGSGTSLSLIYIYFQSFPDTSDAMIILICCTAFHFLSILVRIQNHRGKILTGKTGFDEKQLKFVFPMLGFAVGIAILFFRA